MKRRKSSPRYKLRHVLLGLVLLSAYQYYELGRITWHLAVVDTIEDYAAELVPGFPGASEAVPPDLANGELTGRAVTIRDGDTFVLRTDDRQEYNIRLYGIDAPESDQPHGQAATLALKRQIEGRMVSVRVQDVDQYGRQVGTVLLGSSDINLGLVSAGHAWWYQQYARSNTELAAAEEQARAARIGLWEKRDPVEPWDWRRRRR